MGFESAHAARRRLAVLAMSNERVHEALAPATFPGFEPVVKKQGEQLSLMPAAQPDVTHHLDELAHDIIATPGAGGALLVAFAAQARALALVIEAVSRAQGPAALPAEVMIAVQSAMRVPSAVAGLEFAWRR